MCLLDYADTIEDARALLPHLLEPGESAYVFDTRLHYPVLSTTWAELHRREDEEYSMNEELDVAPALLTYPEGGCVLRVVGEGRMRARSGEWIDCFTLLPEDKPHWGP